MPKILNKILFGILIALSIFAGYLFIGSSVPAQEITWGVNFSHEQAEYLGLDWRKTYLALLDDLGVKNIKIAVQWNLIEKESGKYDFEDLDWQIKWAEERGAKLFLVIGVKTGRWPECHEPGWVKVQSSNLKSQNLLLGYIEKAVNRYKDSPTILAWQVENEPFFPFGECSWVDKNFLKKEIDLVKSLDAQRPVIVSDSGEFSFWITAARFGDVVSTTLHRRVWFQEIKTYITYPLRPVFYWRKHQIIGKLFGKEVIVGELQSEPWCPLGIAECELKEQEKTMSFKHFKENIEFTRNTGLDKIYLWGAEWIYWMKEKQNRPEFWEEARKLF